MLAGTFLRQILEITTAFNCKALCTCCSCDDRREKAFTCDAWRKKTTFADEEEQIQQIQNLSRMGRLETVQ